MKVGIYSNNAQVNTALVSMCASCGCKVQKILKYNKEQFKGSDMILIDLDNCEDSKDVLDEDIQSMPEIVFIGISKDLDLLDNYRGVMNVERKPFSNKVFKHYKDLVLKRLEATIVITKEENRIYDEFGINLGATFSNSNIAIEDRLSVLKNTIKEKSNYDSEEVFLKKIGLDNIEYREAKKVSLERIDIQKEINTDAIVKYRIRKLKMMNLSNKDIDNRINDFINSNINVSITRPKMSSGEQDILSKLRKQGQRGKSFQERKRELEQEKKVSVENMPQPEAPKKVEAPINKEPPKKAESQVEVPKNEPKKPVLNKPILSNDGPPLKKPETIKKPMVSIGIEDVKEEPIEVKKPAPTEPPKKPAFVRPQLLLDNDIPEKSKEEVKPEVVAQKPKEEDDALAKFREEREARKKKLEERKAQLSSNEDNKTNTLNINEDKIIKDNNENAFGTSLVDRMQEQIGYINTHKKPRKETAFDIANKKSKPPR